MKTRNFGNTGWKISEIGLGTWQLGADWGDISDATAEAILSQAIESGVNFFDTADVYGLGISESRIAQFLKHRSEKIIVATKLGRHPEPGLPGNLSLENFRTHTEASLRRLNVEALDLTQVHCLPTEVLKKRELFDWLRILKKEGKIKHFGLSVESMEEAKICLQEEGLTSLQIIFNIFRQKPAEEIFVEAKEKGIALIIRLPLASGLLAGKINQDTRFPENDHRNFNQNGEQFNVGETFAGLPLGKGLELLEDIKVLVPEGLTLGQLAMRWILDFDAVSAVIPGAKSPQQVQANCSASDLPKLSEDLHQRLEKFYQSRVKQHIRGKY